jgi:hypothetical protein
MAMNILLWRCKLELEQALELIPDKEKMAYSEAMHRVPDLVDSESDPFRFLWYENTI